MILSSTTTGLIKEFCQKNDVSMIGLFGSYARGEETESSDIDLLIRFRKKISLLKHIRLERELTNTLGKQVDLITEEAISPYLREQILAEVQILYEEK